jgi:hypothetical protein
VPHNLTELSDAVHHSPSPSCRSLCPEKNIENPVNSANTTLRKTSAMMTLLLYSGSYMDWQAEL